MPCWIAVGKQLSNIRLTQGPKNGVRDCMQECIPI